MRSLFRFNKDYYGGALMILIGLAAVYAGNFDRGLLHLDEITKIRADQGIPRLIPHSKCVLYCISEKPSPSARRAKRAGLNFLSLWLELANARRANARI